MIKQRIAALEAAAERVNAPSREEYDEAVYRAFEHYLERTMEHVDAGSVFIPVQEETAGSELIKAFERVHGPQKNTGLIDKFLLETDQTTEY